MKVKQGDKEYNYNYRALWVSPEIHTQIRHIALKNETSVNGAISILLNETKQSEVKSK
jgi:hypothetical protein